MPDSTLMLAPGSPTNAQNAGLFPGANMGGGGVGFSTPAPYSGIGGATSPFTPVLSSGMRAAPAPAAGTTSPYNTSAGTTAIAGLGGAGGTTGTGQKNLTSGFMEAGFPTSLASSLSKFVSGGSGFSPQVAQALIAALQPQFATGEANLAEQFGSMGLGSSSANAIAQGQYEASTNLAVGQLLSGLYEQSIQNYLSVLLPTSTETSQRISANASMLNAKLSPLNSLLGNLSFGGVSI